MNFSIYDDEQPELKYRYGGNNIRFPEIEQYTLLFAFDYISLSGTKLCFDNSTITSEDFIKIFHFKKAASSIKINAFIDDGRIKKLYHFHSVDIYQKKNILLSPLRSLLGKQIDIDKLPTLYQFAIYTDNDAQKAPRIIGFFGKMGVFHVLWLDYEHSIYPAKN